MSNSKQTPDLTDWKPGDDMGFVFEDKTEEPRSSAEIQALIADLTEAANRHDFDLSHFGTLSSLAQFFHRYYEANGNPRPV